MASNADGTVTLKTKGKTARLVSGGSAKIVEPTTPSPSAKVIGVKGRTVVGKKGKLRA